MIRHVKLGDKDYPVKFGFNALALYTEMTDRGLEAIGEGMTISEMLTFVWIGLKEGARAEGKELELTKEQVADFLDDRPEALTEFFDVFNDQTSKATGAVKEGKSTST